MFFDPNDYLAADLAKAGSEREAERLRREAEQRARLCEATTRLAAEGGLEAAAIHLAARRAGIGQGTYYKLYGSRDACLQEAFERCAETVFTRVAEVAESEGPGARIEAGLGELLHALDADPDVAHLLLAGILGGDPSCRMARECALGRFAALLANGCGGEEAARRGALAWLAAAAIASTLALWLDRDDAPPQAQMLEELLGVASWVQRGAPVVAEPGGDETGGGAPDAAPESRRDAPRRRERREQRRRILAAMVACIGREVPLRVLIVGRFGAPLPVAASGASDRRETLVSPWPSAGQASLAFSRRRSASLCVRPGSSTASLRSASISI